MRSLRVVSSVVFSVVLPVMSLALVAGCKQDIGDRCQVKTDCADFPTARCSADGVCRIDTGTLPADAGTPDASIDAALDNPVDAPVSSAVDAPSSTPDAAPADATLEL